MRLFVGNLAFSVVDEDLRKHFEDNGFTPTDLRVMTDRETGRSRGFAFVSFSTADEANLVVQQLDGSMVGGRDLRLSVAHDRPSGPSGGPRPSAKGGPGYSASHKTDATVVSRQQPYKPQEAITPPRRQGQTQTEPQQYKSSQSYTAPIDEGGGKSGERRRTERVKGKRRRDEEDGDDW